MMHGYQYLYLDHDHKEGKKKNKHKHQAKAYRENNPKFFKLTRTTPDFTKFYTNCERDGKQKMRANLTHFIKISVSVHLHATVS